MKQTPLRLAAIASVIVCTLVGVTPANADDRPPLVGPQLTHGSGCPANYQSVVPDAASLKAYGAEAFLPAGADKQDREAIENNPTLTWALAHDARWIAAECVVTDVSAGPSGESSAGLANGSKAYSNWAGWQFVGPGTGHPHYGYAGMRWKVPAAEFGVVGTQRDVTIWPGIGTGSSVNDVLAQVGTQTTSGPAGVQATYAWTELYPVQPTEVQITNMPVAAGALVDATVQVNYNYTPAHVSFWFCNGQAQCVTINATVPSPGVVTGQTAEFIVERPGIGGGYSELADFGYEQVNYASAATSDALGTRRWATNASWPGEVTDKITMKSCNGATTLAAPSDVPSGSPTGNFKVLWYNHGSLESC